MTILANAGIAMQLLLAWICQTFGLCCTTLEPSHMPPVTCKLGVNENRVHAISKFALRMVNSIATTFLHKLQMIHTSIQQIKNKHRITTNAIILLLFVPVRFFLRRLISFNLIHPP